MPSFPLTGFGTVLEDFDNDGWLDLLVANGSVMILEERARTGAEHPLDQPNQLFRNDGSGNFALISGSTVGRRSEVSRGAAAGDVDNDGDIDVLVINNHQPARLLINRSGSTTSWVGLRLVGNDGRRDMLGARVGLVRPGMPVLWRRARSDGSYASAGDPRILFGLGDSDAPIEQVDVQWPSGRAESFRGIEPERYTTLVEGRGQASGPP